MAIINNSNQRSAKEIFLEALEQPTPNDRAAYLDAACGHDPRLRQRVVELLAHRFEPDSFMQNPAVEVATAPVPLPIREGPGSRIGRYKLLQAIGEGGMGVVYMAEQEEPIRRCVALKIIKLGMDTRQVVARFEAERQALALMDHPNIARVLDGGATDMGRPYFVMELVQGVPITEFCDKNRMPVVDRLKLFIPVCQAIQSVYQKGIIHRDLKPSNILVTLNGGVPVPKVIDFGVAKATNQRLTEKTLFTNYGTMMGTPAYMSPEQAEMTSLDVDTRADIYGLGVLLYELVTGSTPFPEKWLRSVSYIELQRIIVEERPERPSTRLGTMLAEQRSVVARNHGASELTLAQASPSDLDWIVMKCLEKDRARRYQTANGLANDIQRHLNTEPISARPPSWLYEFQKTVRRHWVGFGATAAVLVVLALGVVISTWEVVRARRAEREQIHLRLAAQTAQAKETEQRQRAEVGERLEQRLLYAANMNLAQQAWEQNHVARVCQLLGETAGYLDRGFEWYYWQRQTHLELKTLRGHLGAVWTVVFSPDGRRIVTGSEDRTAKVWDAANGKELFTLGGHRLAIAVAVSPNGQRIVTASVDRTARIWDAAIGRELLTLKGHGAPILAVAVSLDGLRIVTGSEDQTAKIWEAASGKQLFTLRGHSASVVSVAFSPDGQRIVTGSADQNVKVWESGRDEETLTLKGHSGEIPAVAFSPDGQRIVTGSVDQTAKVWEAGSEKELLTLKGHSRPVRSVAFSPDGQRIVTGSRDETATVWDGATGRQLFSLPGHGGAILSVAVSPDGRRIATGGADHRARVWEAASGEQILKLEGHRDGIFAVAFSPDGRRIATGSRDHTAKVWEAASGKLILTFPRHEGGIFSLGFSPDGQRIITGSEDKTARVWDASNGGELLVLRGHSDEILAVAFSPDGRRILTGSRDQTAKLWDPDSGHELLTLQGHAAYISSLAFSPDGQWIVTASGDKTARVWKAATPAQVALWQAEGQEAEEHLATVLRERAATAQHERALRTLDPGAIKQWLVLAPIPYQGRSGAAALTQEQVPHEANLHARPGEPIQVGEEECRWRAVPLDDYLIDFNQLAGTTSAWSVAYAVSYLQSDVDQTALLMKVGSDDQSKVYLNGKEIYRHEEARTYLPDQDVVSTGVELKAGLNVLVFKVVNQTGDWLGSIRFTDAAGQPLKGIRVTLDPGKRDQ